MVGWRIVDSQHFGVPQRRRRVFVVCGPTEAGVAKVLALTEGCGGDRAAGREAGAGAADPAAYSTSGAGWWRRGLGTLTARDWRDGETSGLVTHSLRAEGHDASEDGTGRGTQLVVYDQHQVTSPDNRSNPKPGDPCHPLARHAEAPLVVELAHRGANQTGVREGATYPFSATQAVAFHATQDPISGTVEPAMGTGNRQGHATIGVQTASAVRRLTPLECERLQGFPDGWTCLCQPLAAYASDPDGAALQCRCPDSPRYRALGNAVTVPVIRWFGERLRDRMTREG